MSETPVRDAKTVSLGTRKRWICRIRGHRYVGVIGLSGGRYSVVCLRCWGQSEATRTAVLFHREVAP